MAFDDQHCQRWWVSSKHGVKSALDANADGAVTIGDFLTWAGHIFHFPSQAAMLIIDGMPQVASFFEINCSTGTGWGGAMFSFFVWLLMPIGLVSAGSSNQSK